MGFKLDGAREHQYYSSFFSHPSVANWKRGQVHSSRHSDTTCRVRNKDTGSPLFLLVSFGRRWGKEANNHAGRACTTLLWWLSNRASAGWCRWFTFFYSFLVVCIMGISFPFWCHRGLEWLNRVLCGVSLGGFWWGDSKSYYLLGIAISITWSLSNKTWPFGLCSFFPTLFRIGRLVGISKQNQPGFFLGG